MADSASGVDTELRKKARSTQSARIPDSHIQPEAFAVAEGEHRHVLEMKESSRTVARCRRRSGVEI